MSTIIRTVLAFFVLAAAGGQALAEDHGTGLIPDTLEQRTWADAHLAKVTSLPLNDLAKSRLAAERAASISDRSGVPLVGAYPNAVDNSASAAFPPIADQGALNSCVGFATTYYAFTYEMARAQGWTANTGNLAILRSPKFTYNMINGGIDGGSSPLIAIQSLMESGAPSWASWPYDSNYLAYPTNGAVWKEALTSRIDSAYEVTGSTLQTIQGNTLLRTALANGYVVTMCTYVDSWSQTTLKDNPATTIDDAIVNHKVCAYMNGEVGSHLMTIVGYNDQAWCDINGNGIREPGEYGAFKVANSWGTTDWNAGFRWVAYDAFYPFSHVSPPPSQPNRKPICTSAYFFDASTRTPTLLAQVTANHASRNDVKFSITASTATGSSTAAFTPLACDGSYVGGNCNWAGVIGGPATTATFWFDISSLEAGNPEWTSYTLGATDGLLNGSSPLTVPSFSLETGSGLVLPSMFYTPISRFIINGTLTAYVQLPRLTCQAPVISPPGGIMVAPNAITVSASTPTAGATIYYTTDGSTPSTASAVWNGELSVSANVVIKAVAQAAGKNSSAITTATFSSVPDTRADVVRGLDAAGTTDLALTGNAAWYETTETFKYGGSCVRSGAIGPNQASTMAILVNGPVVASWWWAVSSEPDADKMTVSLDGAPLASISGIAGWSDYTLAISPGAHVLAWCYSKNQGITIGRDAGYVDQVIMTPAAGPVVFSPAGGSYLGPQTITMSAAPSGSVIRYTTDGSNPTASSTLYTGPLAVLGSQTIKAIATSAGVADSLVYQANYTITAIPVATPAVTPSSLAATAAFTVAVSCATPGSIIHYTLNGSAPTLTSPVITGPVTISAYGATTLRVFAEAPGYLPSSEATGSYTLPWVPLTVAPRTIYTKYGDPIPPIQVDYTGFIDGDTISCLQGALSTTTAATSWSDVGTYSVTCSGHTSTKYRIQYQDGTISMGRGDPVVSWSSNPCQIVYGPTLGDLFPMGVSSVAGSWSAVLFDTSYRPQAGSRSIAFTFSPTDPAHYNSQQLFVTFDISKAPATVTAGSATCAYGEPIPSLSATHSGLVGSDSIYDFSAQPSVTTAAVRGSMVGHYPTYPICGTHPNYTNVYVAGVLTIVPATPVITWPTPAAMHTGSPLSTTQLNPYASVPGVFNFNPPMGTVLPAGGATVSATFVPSDQTNYGSATAAVFVAVSDTVCSITWPNPDPIVYGTAIGGCLNPTADLPGQFTFDVTPGLVPHAGTHVVTALFTSQDGSIRNMPATTAVTVSPAPLVISATSASRPTKQANPAFSIQYAGFVNQDGPAQLTTPATATCSASPSSIPGSYPIVVSGASSADYAITYAQGTLTVVVTQPTITWATPDAIAAGIALSSRQLNASVDQPGSLTYQPASGTVLPVGRQILTVSFSPSDQLVASGSATVALVVTGADSTPAAPVVLPTATAAAGGGGGGGGGCGLGGMGCLVIALGALFRRRMRCQEPSLPSVQKDVE